MTDKEAEDKSGKENRPLKEEVEHPRGDVRLRSKYSMYKVSGSILSRVLEEDDECDVSLVTETPQRAMEGSE